MPAVVLSYNLSFATALTTTCACCGGTKERQNVICNPCYKSEVSGRPLSYMWWPDTVVAKIALMCKAEGLI